MFTEETIGRDDVREPALSTLDADFAVHATAIEELYQTILTEIAEAARAWTPETARLEAQRSLTEAILIPSPRRPSRAESRALFEEEARVSEPRTEAITLPQVEARTEARTEAITAPRTDAIAAQQAITQEHAPVRTRGAHHAETGQMAAISVRPAVPRTLAA